MHRGRALGHHYLRSYKGVTKGMERDKSPTFLDGMQKQFASKRTIAPLEDDDDELKVGAWTSSAGICKIARGETRIGQKKGLRLAVAKEESSFESLDLRAAEVLDKSMRALESSTSLTSCAFAMTIDYPHFLGGGGGWDVEKGKLEDGRTHNWDPSEHLHSCQNKERARMCSHGCDHDIARVLKEIINNTNDYGVKLCNVAKTYKDTVDRMLVKDLNNVNTKENAFEDSLDQAKTNLWNDESPKKRTVDCSGQVLPRPASQDDMSIRQADEEGGAFVAAEKMRDATKGTAPSLDRLTQTKQTGLPGCNVLPPKVSRSGDLGPPAMSKGELPRKINSVAVERKRKRSVKSRYGAKHLAHFERRKLVWPSKPPKWRGLSTALAVMRSICHGAGEVGVVDAQARPLLIIAGKCVFRTTAPLDTPRLCTFLNEGQGYVPRATNADEDSLPSSSSAGVSSTQDARKASSHAQLTSKSMLRPVIRIDGTSSTLPGQKCQATLSSIKYWPAVVTELDNWISQVVNEWLDKDDHVAAVGTSPLSHPSATVVNPVPSGTRGGGCSEEKLGASCVPPISKVTAVCNQSFKSLPNMLEEVGKSLTVPSKKLIELDARIHEAQTVYDLSQMLEPISQPLMSSVPVSKVTGDIKTSPMSIIQEFGRDEVVQEFQRQIHILEQENENLKSSLCEQEHSDLFRRLKALNL